MTDVTVRNMPEKLVEKLRSRARVNDRSIEEEILSIVKSAFSGVDSDTAAIAAAIRNRLSGRKHTDSALLLAKDRGRAE